MPSSLESDVAVLLTDLLAGQNDLMEILGRKRALLGTVDHAGLAAITADEKRLLGTLQDCLRRRGRATARGAGGSSAARPAAAARRP